MAQRHHLRLFRMAQPPLAHDAEATDPALLKDNSALKSYTVKGFTYPQVRVFFRQRPKIEEFPQHPAALPLLVFIHGLGGSVAQFHPLLTSLTNNASCLAVDLPGCGRFAFVPQDWAAYTTDVLVELLETIIDDYRDKEHNQGVVLIGHSMGTVIAARLANKEGPHVTSLSSHVLGIIAICPVAGPPSKATTATFRRLLWIPTWLFDLFRRWDQRGGPESASVSRFVGPEADAVCRELQDRFNKQSRTPVFRRMAWGSLPSYVGDEPSAGLFGQPTWAGLDMPVFLIGAEKDTVVSPRDVDRIAKLLESKRESIVTNESGSSGTIGESAAPVVTTTKLGDHLPESINDITAKDFERRQLSANVEESFEEATTPRDAGESPGAIPPQPLHPKKFIKTRIMPAPATHAVLYNPKSVRTLSSLISDFMAEHISGRLEFGWQLQHLNRLGKWELKNLKKWQAIQPVSASIHGIFRAMKTLREVDEEHSPSKFSEKWGGIVKDIIDISKDNPAYDPRGLEREGIKYHKFPTVSKIPPTDEEVATFVALVDQVREDQRARAQEQGWQEYAIGVHCHYGFNRTGYFIVCYLVEKCEMNVQEAINLFAIARPNGIRHSHFLDRLERRYSGLNN
ncbi:dual specificity phosphatase catalytic domain protein [Seiridium cupressi]